MDLAEFAYIGGFPFFQTLKGTALTLLVLWTIAANALVFIVLYKNPRLQTVPNLLVRRFFKKFQRNKSYVDLTAIRSSDTV